MIETLTQRSRPWFGQYHLCGKLRLKDAYALRGLDHGHIDTIIADRRRWATVRVNHGGSWRTSAPELAVSEQQQADLHAMCDFLLSDAGDRKITLAADRLYLYTNDRMLLDRVARFPVGQLLEISSVDLKGDPDAVNLQQSAYSLRSYFRTQRVEIKILRALRSYLDQQDLRISPGLRWALDNDFQRLHDYYFIDYSSASIVTMMNLIQPGLIRQTLPISVAK